MNGIPSITDQEFSERFSQRLSGGRFPLSGQWEITCRCNLRCIMCYTDCFNSPEMIQQELNLPEIVRIMDEIQEAGCLELCLTGGELLARKDFLDIYTYAKQKGFLVTVFTNGTLLTEKIADYWVQYPPSMIEISFHGLTEQSFERITQGPGSYERCLAGIRLILERKLPLTLKTTGMTANRDEVLRIKEYVAHLGREYSEKVQYKFGSDIRPRLDGSDDVRDHEMTISADFVTPTDAELIPTGEIAAVTGTPAKTADQAAGLVWFIESRPRVALGWMAAVKMSSRRQSFVGKVSGKNAAPVCKAQSSIV